MPPTTCPDRERLIAFALGKLAPAELDDIAGHLEQCRTCLELLKEPGPDGDGLLSTLRQCATVDTFDQESACQRVLARVESLTQSPGGAGRQGTEGQPVPEVLGRYQVLAKIAAGGMGAVYRALHTLLKREVALKVLPLERIHNPEAVARFHREIEAAGRLRHDNLVHASDADQAGDVHFLVMEWLDGPDLSRLVKERGPLPVSEACEWARQAALGLQHAHENGLIHRDVKPGNLMLNGKGMLKVLDLGLALLYDQPEEEEVTASGQIMGTFDYMAPEQASNTHAADARADVYSLGCTLYFLLAGKPPFAHRVGLRKLTAHESEPPPPLGPIRPDIPAELLAVVDKMLAKDPAQRFASMSEVADALQAYAQAVAPRPVPAADVSHSFQTSPTQTFHSAPGPRRTGSHRRRAVAAAVCALLLAALTLGAVTFYLKTRNGVIEVKVSEPGVKVFIDGNEKLVLESGKAGRIELSAGEHELKVTRGDEVLHTRSFSLKSGEELLLEAHWQPRQVMEQPGPVTGVAMGPSPLDLLDPGTIPASERFDWQPRELVAVLGEHARRHWDRIHWLAYSPDGKYLASTGGDTFLYLWEAGSLKNLATATHPQFQTLSAAAFHPEGNAIAAACSDGIVYLWDVRDGRLIAGGQLDTGQKAATAVAFSPCGRYLVAACDNGVLAWWPRGEKKARLATVKIHTKTIRYVGFSADGKTMFSASDDRAVQLWDWEDGTPRPTAEVIEHSESDFPVALSPDGATLAVGNGESVRLWNLGDGGPKQGELLTGTGSRLAFSPDGKLLATSRKKDVKLWKMEGGRAKEWIRFHTTGIMLHRMAFSPDGRTLATGDWDGVVKTWDLTDPVPKENHPIDSEKHYSITLWGTGRLAFSGEGKVLACADLEGRIQLWKLDGASPKRERILRSKCVYSLALAPDGSWVAGDYNGRIAQFWKLEGVADPVPQPLDSPAGASYFAISDSGSVLAVSGFYGTDGTSVALWDVRSKVPKQKEVLKQTVLATTLAISADGGLVAVGTLSTGIVNLWDLSPGKRRPPPVLKYQQNVNSLALHPREKLLAWGGSTIMLWDFSGPDPKLQANLPISGHWVSSVDFSPDGERLLTTSNTGELAVWDVKSEKRIRRWILPGLIQKALFAPDGRHIATLNGNGTIYILRLGS